MLELLSEFVGWPRMAGPLRVFGPDGHGRTLDQVPVFAPVARDRVAAEQRPLSYVLMVEVRERHRPRGVGIVEHIKAVQQALAVFRLAEIPTNGVRPVLVEV